MNNTTKLLTLLLMISVTTVSCSNWVGANDEPIDEITDDALTNEEQIPFIESGVLALFAQTHDNLSVTVDGLSDALQFDSDGNSLATFPTYAELDQGDITFDNNSVDGVYRNLNEMRFLADDLIRRIGEIEFEDGAIREQALYTANFAGGLSRYWLGSYFGLTPTEPGAPIDNSDIISQAQLYSQALDYYDEALSFASAEQATIINSLKAELYITQNDYASAATILQGSVLEEGDDPLQSLHSIESQNAWYNAAGEGRTQLNVDSRYADYIADEPAEANRIGITPFDEDASGQVITYYYANYGRTAPIDVVTWQEVALMRAEILVNNGTADVGAPGETALSLINNVRASHSIPPMTGTVDMAVILEERDKELFATGQRLLDQVRTGNFHLEGGTLYSVPSSSVTGNQVLLTDNPWQHLPITSQERNNNPNLN